jgi:hypothetical protein
LSDEQVARLEALGFDFDRNATKWDEKYQELVAFKNEHGHCNVPQGAKLNHGLGTWVANQRRPKFRVRLSDEQIARFEDLAFDFDPHSAK